MSSRRPTHTRAFRGTSFDPFAGASKELNSSPGGKQARARAGASQSAQKQKTSPSPATGHPCIPASVAAEPQPGRERTAENRGSALSLRRYLLPEISLAFFFRSAAARAISA
jgi:hypothetical protein